MEYKEDDDARIGDENKIAPYGTWEYMAPECWKRKYGKPGFASDIFSFGLMLWEMVARMRVYTVFPGVADIANADGSANVKLVAARLASGQRPEAPEGCPVLLFKLMQACWVNNMEDRPTAARLLHAIRAICVTPGAMGSPPEPEPEPGLATYAATHDDV